MEWVAAAEEFLGKYGWGARGRNLGVSRMFGEGDKASLSRNALSIALRPRGVLSGFLAIVPECGVVYIPPIAAKVPPMRLRLRVSDTLLSSGAVFSAYLTRDSPRRLVLEDVLVWKGEAVWNTKTFGERWNKYMGDFVNNHFRSDLALQGCIVELAEYKAVTAAFPEPDEKSVAEFVPNAPNSKRLIWMPPRIVPALTPHALEFTVRKEVGMGPDVYAVYRKEERLGLALVRTLAVSRALRLAAGAMGGIAPVRAEHNKVFDKYEILEVVGAVGENRGAE
jgi:hypothetical protein